MSNLREAAQQALKALESGLAFDKNSEVLQNLRAALEQQAEPVAWWHRNSDTFTSGNLISNFDEWTPLYTVPPQQQSDPLIAEQRLDIVATALRGHASTRDAIQWAIEAVERHHGIKE